MDMICCICQQKYGEKPGKGKSHGVCTPCIPAYKRLSGVEDSNEDNAENFVSSKERSHHAKHGHGDGV